MGLNPPWTIDSCAVDEGVNMGYLSFKCICNLDAARLGLYVSLDSKSPQSQLSYVKGLKESHV